MCGTAQSKTLESTQDMLWTQLGEITGSLGGKGLQKLLKGAKQVNIGEETYEVFNAIKFKNISPSYSVYSQLQLTLLDRNTHNILLYWRNGCN